ncbi:DNA-binding IclR family transcriptional regulator [Kibdelosporangium banguiense]|uniref:DNA-binding IclR family transcriptional regulator n=1 Tax=Kibdelosporangium banguiense TaxID=1365924 RepID=A0ABS4TY02_9PSEU|nr:helix-turn-helix domain-containing protein [Kibdelosporangium banguiense]MBP2329283.1 DNA-binding IclR family transcriptional regulator [Kibdelosporangium banguiense]
MPETRDRNSVQSVEKAMRLLHVLGRAGTPLPPGELAAATGLSNTAAHRLLRALEKGGAVARIGDGRYAIGFLAHELAARADPHGHIRLAATGPMLTLQEQCGGETVGIYVPVNSAEFMCIETIPSKHGIRYMEVLYRPITIGRGATSLVFLAAMEDRYGHDALLSYLHGIPDHLRPFPAAELADRVHYVITNGYAESEGTRVPGLTSLSAPIRGRLGGTLGALTLSWPSGRADRATLPDWTHRLRAATAAVAERLSSEFPGDAAASTYGHLTNAAAPARQ